MQSLSGEALDAKLREFLAEDVGPEDVTTAPGKTFLIATEEGIIHQMKKIAPDRTYIPVPPDNGCRCNECPFMKLNTLEKLYLCLRDERPEIVLPEDLRRAAEKPLLRMLELS